MITSSRVCEIAEVPSTTLADWVAKGFVIPAVPGGVGRGKSHRFTVTQAVGVAVAVALSKSERGCSTEHAARVVEAFGKMTESELAARFCRGATHFLFVGRSGHVAMDGPYYPDQPVAHSVASDLVDVEAIYDRVKASAAAV